MTFPDKELSCVGLYFGTPEAPSLTTIPIKSATFSVTSICKDINEGEANDVRLPACNAYFLMLYLEDTQHSDIRADGTCTPIRRYAQGSICLVDLDDGAAIRLHSRLSSLAFVLPKPLFEEAAALSPGMEAGRLVCWRGKPDGVLANLGSALLALLAGGRTASPPALLPHVAVAICAHLLHQYGETPNDGEPPLSLIATTGSLAGEQFSREFTPAARQRVERAKGIMAEHTLSLEAIARQCGFGDLEHFNQVFMGETGVTPAAWSRKHLN